jgi:hypothetical protein
MLITGQSSQLEPDYFLEGGGEGVRVKLKDAVLP